MAVLDSKGYEDAIRRIRQGESINDELSIELANMADTYNDIYTAAVQKDSEIETLKNELVDVAAKVTHLQNANIELLTRIPIAGTSKENDNNNTQTDDNDRVSFHDIFKTNK